MPPLLRKGNFRNEPSEQNEDRKKFIDLAEIKMPVDPSNVGTLIKIADVNNFEDVKKISEHVRDGNIVLMDCSSVMGDDLLFRRVVDEMKAIGKDVGGDVAGLGKNLFVITPQGIAVDRNKIRGSF